VVNASTGDTLLPPGRTYTAGDAIRFGGLEVVIGDIGMVPQAGDTFAISTTKGAAREISVAANILQDVNTIAAGQTPEQGDNANALAVADLQEAQQFPLLV
jgi:hypothetical protein